MKSIGPSWRGSVWPSGYSSEMERSVDLEGAPRLIELTDDTQHLSTLDGESTRLDTFLWQRSNDRIWLEHAYELTEYSKQTVRLQFGRLDDGHDGLTSMYVDDASWQVIYRT